MTTTEKTQKLIEYSIIISGEEKKSWQTVLPKMSDSDVQIIFNVLSDEVKAWKKEGVSIIPDLAVEMQIVPQSDHGASINALKERLQGGPAPVPAVVPTLTKPLPPPAAKPAAPTTTVQMEGSEDNKSEPVFGEIKEKGPDYAKQAWMVSSKVVVPKDTNIVQPKAKSVPSIRNRVAHAGLSELKNIRVVDDLAKIEPAHLRQGPLLEQVKFIKQRIAQIAKENDMLPINIIPVFEQSPLIQIYLKGGALMIEKNTGENKIGIEDVMNELQQTGMDGLSQQEFEAVADLKKDLEAMSGV